jgi:hypothetical protein
VAEYRAHIIGKDDQIISFRSFNCYSDTEAAVWAKQIVDDNAIEIWSGERFVAMLKAGKE